MKLKIAGIIFLLGFACYSCFFSSPISLNDEKFDILKSQHEVSKPLPNTPSNIKPVDDDNHNDREENIDNKKLDDRVREMAILMKEDPETFMLPIKDEGGYKVYRKIGSFVIVNHGKTTYLPDEF